MKILGLIFYLLCVMNMSSCRYWPLDERMDKDFNQKDEVGGTRNLKKLGKLNQSEVTNLSFISSDLWDEIFNHPEDSVKSSDYGEQIVFPENEFDFQLDVEKQQRIDDFQSDDAREGVNGGDEIDKDNLDKTDRVDGNKILEEREVEFRDNFENDDSDLGGEGKVYDSLLEKVQTYKAKFLNERDQFYLTKLFSNIPFDKISSDFSFEEEQDKVYAGLGYNVGLIARLGNLFDKLLLTNISNGILEVFDDVLSVLSELSQYPKDSLELLNEEILANIRERDIDIKRISDALDNIVQLKEELVEDIRDNIESLGSIDDESEIISLLQKDFGEGKYKMKISVLREFAMLISNLVVN
ncbi:hypothetical protein [Borrelia crocidurae]|uniref:Putative viral A-type inclusion protein repeat protein n=1 Tax=Borrelia crocidurae (strain Achema) TaxID=1155096 RepID=I0FE67_BORCA|nr:hypothetical protein [Borrelia crocidurae]AFI31773.1 Putative viral A-type inclusion protein repeat protein [Borrelia crocidurae str. Achema]